MITRAAASLLAWYAPRRRRALETIARRAVEVQERTLQKLVRTAIATRFGREHRFAAIRSIADYQARVPVRDDLGFRPWWADALAGEADVTWPGRARYWAKSSGTTSGDTLIPVTSHALTSHQRGGWDALVMAVERVGAARLLGGPMLFLGGSARLTPVGADALAGDLSGLAIRGLPPGVRGRCSPGRSVAALADWETRIDAIAQLSARQDLRLLAGMPSWLLVLFLRVMEARLVAGRPVSSLAQAWPNLGVVVHGGLSFAPYRDLFAHALGDGVQYVEAYPASEAFIGLQTERSGGGLTLMLDYDVFYEFIPVEQVGMPDPPRHTVETVQLHRAYAIALTTAGGLWSYLLGDTVRFVARDPMRLQITGRTHPFVSASGEHVIGAHVEAALLEACRRGCAEVIEFTVAPRYPTRRQPRGGHDWLVEFAEPPRAPGVFTRVLDESLQRLNADYRMRRAGDVGMLPPRVLELPAGTFHAWVRERGRLAERHTVPRVTNGRDIADGLLAIVAARGREPLLVSSAATHVLSHAE